MMLKKYIKRITPEVWNIGLIQNSLESILSKESYKVHWIKHNYSNSWFADPFILDITEKYFVILAEEFYKPIQRGRICKLIIDKNSFVVIDKQTILELDTHLSFPAIERNNEHIYIYPENSESGNLKRYLYDPNTNECLFDQIICNYPVTDGIIINIEDEKYLFGTVLPQPNGNILHIFKWNQKERLFIPYDTISFKENIARMSGHFFYYKQQLFRPTQECNEQYGHAVTLQKIDLSDNKLSCKEVARLYSPHPQLNVGMHTFNVYNDWIVTDALGFKNKWIRNVLKLIKS